MHRADLDELKLTFEVDLGTTVFQFDTENVLAQRFVIVRDVSLLSPTERQREVIVGFLSIVIRANGVHPENDFLTVLILDKERTNERTCT